MSRRRMCWNWWYGEFLDLLNLLIFFIWDIVQPLCGPYVFKPLCGTYTSKRYRILVWLFWGTSRYADLMWSKPLCGPYDLSRYADLMCLSRYADLVAKPLCGSCEVYVKNRYVFNLHRESNNRSVVLGEILFAESSEIRAHNCWTEQPR